MASIAKVRGIEKLSSGDLRALVKTAQWIGINPDWLASVMSFESGFNPAAVNKAGSGATGLIQFMPDTAKRLGTTTDKLKKMSFQSQLEYVKKYFAPMRGKLKSLEDTYLTVFYPAAIGEPLDHVVGKSGSAIYAQNKGFDKTGKGYITKSDITTTIRGVLNSAQGRVAVGVVSIGMLATLGFVGYYFFFRDHETRVRASTG
jgi:hypothetical protein